MREIGIKKDGIPYSLDFVPEVLWHRYYYFHPSAGDGYCLKEEMGLENNKLSYNAVVVSTILSYLYDIYIYTKQATIHELCYGAGLDWHTTYSRQSKEKLVRIFEVVSFFVLPIQQKG